MQTMSTEIQPTHEEVIAAYRASGEAKQAAALIAATEARKAALARDAKKAAQRASWAKASAPAPVSTGGHYCGMPGCRRCDADA